MASRLDAYAALRGRKEAEDKLPVLRAELRRARERLAKLKMERGLFVSGSIRDAERQMQRLQAEIAHLEKYMM